MPEVNVMNNYKLNRFLRKYGPHIIALVVILLISFYDRFLAAIVLVIYVAIAVLFTLSW